MSRSNWVVTADKFLNLEQVRALLVHLEQGRDLAIARDNDIQAIRDYYLLRGLLETGLRVAEFCALANGDLQGHKLTVRRGKGGKSRTVLLTKATALMLKEWTTVKQRLGLSLEPEHPMFPSRYGKPYTTRGVQLRVKAAFKSADLPEQLTTHSTRHTYCSLLLASGKASLATVKENMGHSSIAVTNIYSHSVGNLDAVELYPTSTSQFSEKHEVDNSSRGRNINSSVKAFLRNANFKPS